eukprot:UN05421
MMRLVIFVSFVTLSFGEGSEQSSDEICEDIRLLRDELTDELAQEDAYKFNDILKQIISKQEALGGEESETWQECKHTVTYYKISLR